VKQVGSGLAGADSGFILRSNLAFVGSLHGQLVEHKPNTINLAYSSVRSATILNVVLSSTPRTFIHSVRWTICGANRLDFRKIKGSNYYSWALGKNQRFLGCYGLRLNRFKGSPSRPNSDSTSTQQEQADKQRNTVYPVTRYRHGGKFADSYGFACIAVFYVLTIPFVWCGCDRIWNGHRFSGSILLIIGFSCDILAHVILGIGCLPWDWWRCLHDGQEHSQREYLHHDATIVLQKYLTQLYSCSTVIDMANVLNTDKQIAIIGALAEGSSIRSIERITGVHRDTIMRLGVKVGRGCATLLDSKMRDLPCRHLQFDEIWGFIGKKQRNLLVDDDETQFGDVWTFCAIDAEPKLVPSFRCGKRDAVTTNAFVEDVASRMRTRVQVTTDALRLYVEAIERGFGADVDYGRVIKTYAHDDSIHPERRYSAPEIVTTEKEIVNGNPDMELASTSHVERLNGTTRLHMRRLTRLTYAFSKKLENFKAAAALHFAYYNFVKRHGTLRCTPAMAAGVEQSFWSVGDLVEASA